MNSFPQRLLDAGNGWNGAPPTLHNAGTVAAKTGHCDFCSASFFTVSPKTRFCSVRCKNAFWKAEYKLLGLVDTLLWYFEIPTRWRALVLKAVRRATATFYRYASYLRLHYFPKRRTWELMR